MEVDAIFIGDDDVVRDIDVGIGFVESETGARVVLDDVVVDEVAARVVEIDARVSVGNDVIRDD